MDIAVNPALIVALGGTGQSILNRLRRRIRQRVGTDRLPLLEYLYLDTDKGNKDSGAETGDGIPIGLAPQVATELADLQGRAAMEMELSAWISEDALDRLRRGTLGGAQGFRQLGRVSFLASQKLRELNTQLKERVGNLLEARQTLLHQTLPRLDPKYLKVRLQGAGPKVFIYVLASAGGGTGSSTLVDLGYFIRRALRDGGYESDCKTIGIALIASTAFEEAHQYRYNSGGVLTELNHFLKRPAYRAAYPLAFPGDPLRPDLPRTEKMAGVALNLPFDYHYLVQPAAMHGGNLDPDNPPLAMSRLEQKVAELVLSDTVFAAPPGKMEYDSSTVPPTPPEIVSRVLKGELESRRVDFGGRARKVQYDASYPCDLMTFGVATKEFPAAMHHVLAFGKAVRNLAERWTVTPSRAPDAGPDDLGHEAANRKLAEWLGKLSCLADEHQYAEHRARDEADDQLLRALVQTTDIDVRQQLQATATAQPVAGQQTDPEQWLLSRRGAVDQLLQEVADTPSLGQPGSLFARLRDRRDELAGWTGAGYPNGLATELLDLAFSLEAGPGVALALADRLAQRLHAELDWVKLCRDEPTPVAAAPVARQDRGDWLLLGWRHTLPGGQAVAGVAEQAWDHANGRLLRLVFQGKVQVLEGCLQALARMRDRLVNLRDYYDQWRRQAPDPDDPETQLTRDEIGYVLREDKLIEQFARLDGLTDKLTQAFGRVSLYQRLKADIARGLPAEDAGGGPALLAAGVPLDRRRNQPDFEPLSEIEAAVFEAIGARRDGPYEQEVIDLLERRAAAAGVELPNLQAEASPLLQFDANNPGYAMDCKFGGDVELWQMLSDHNSLNHENFANLVARQQGAFRFPDTPDTKLQAVDTMIPSVVTVVRHRIGVVTPLILGYDPGTVRRMIRGAAHTPLTDIRIRPPLDPNLLWQAGFKILGGLILGHEAVFTVADDKFLFEYTIRDQAGFTRTQQVRLPMDFQAAYELLAQSDDELEELDARLRLKVYELQDGASARLEEVIARVDRQRNEGSADARARRLDVWARNGQTSGIYLANLGYDDVLALLTSFALEYGIRCEVEFQHHYADFKRVGDAIVGGQAQVDGWYCRFCGHYHGSSVPADNRTCSACRNLMAGG